MRYGYRAVARFDGKDAGLIGLATTRERAQAIPSQLSRIVRRERWSDRVWQAVREYERTGRVCVSLPLSLAAKEG